MQHVNLFASWEIALLLLPSLAACSYWLLYAAQDQPSWPRSLLKTTATAGLVLAGAILAGPGLALILVGLAFGAAGDFALSRRGEPAFLAGMAAFALGHLAYTVAMAQRAAGLGGFALGAGQIAAFCGALGVLASTELWLSPHTSRLRWPVRGYVLVIGLMATVTIALPPHGGRAVIWSGATLFVLSDLLLAIEIFIARPPRLKRALRLALWPAYWLGQAAILFGAMLYWLDMQG